MGLIFCQSVQLNAIYRVSLPGLMLSGHMFGLTVLSGRTRAAGNDKIVNSVGNQTFTFTLVCSSWPGPGTHQGHGECEPQVTASPGIGTCQRMGNQDDWGDILRCSPRVVTPHAWSPEVLTVRALKLIVESGQLGSSLHSQPRHAAPLLSWRSSFLHLSPPASSGMY